MQLGDCYGYPNMTKMSKKANSTVQKYNIIGHGMLITMFNNCKAFGDQINFKSYICTMYMYVYFRSVIIL